MACIFLWASCIYVFIAFIAVCTERVDKVYHSPEDF